MQNKVIRGFCYVLAAALFITGAFIFVYPLANKYTVTKNAETNLESFHNTKNTIAEIAENSKLQNEDPDIAYKKQQYDSLYTDLQSYNQEIFENGQEGLKDAWSYEQSSVDLSNYGIYSNIIAEIKIPKMKVDLPVYLGATWKNMGKGAAQLGQTSMPIGGENTNCVIAGHRGSSGGKFFLDIQKLKIGDEVYIENLWENLRYKVSKIEIIKPNEIDKILIEEGKDMVTLITCHPYPYNYRRYVVYCERDMSFDSEMPQSETVVSTEVANENENQSEIQGGGSSQVIITLENISYIAVPMIIIAMIIILVIKKPKKQRR